MLGESPGTRAVVSAFWKVISWAPVNVRGSASGGFEASGVTTFVTG